MKDSITKTKEQIAAYPSYDGWASLHSGDDSSPLIFPVSSLQALATDHTALETKLAALLEVAKGVYNGGDGVAYYSMAMDELQRAIQQAEGEQAEGE